MNTLIPIAVAAVFMIASTVLFVVGATDEQPCSQSDRWMTWGLVGMIVSGFALAGSVVAVLP